MSQAIDPQAAAQLREIRPEREQVVTWTRFRAATFIMRDPNTREELSRVVEFRSLSGDEVHQFVLDDDTRRMLVDTLAYDSAPKIVVPT